MIWTYSKGVLLTSWVQEISWLYNLTVIRNKRIVNQRSFVIIFDKIPNFKVAVTEMYPKIPWELFVDPVGCTEYTLGTTAQRSNYKDSSRHLSTVLCNYLQQICRTTEQLTPECFMKRTQLRPRRMTLKQPTVSSYLAEWWNTISRQK